MTSRSEAFLDSLRQADAGQLRFLAERTMTDSREPYQIATRLFVGTDQSDAAKGMSFLLRAQELAIVPLIESQPARVVDQVSALRMAIAAETKLRRKLAAKLDTLLNDKTPVPGEPPPNSKAEERNPPRRVCDEAYLAMQRLVHFGESELEALSGAHSFLELSDAEKDKLIHQARSSGKWEQALHGDEG